MIRSIQLLRVIAAILVINSHLGTIYYAKYFGTFGVDIFFIVSGFIMAMLMESDTKDFLLKRLIRIFPIYFLFSLIQFIINCLPGHIGYGPRSSIGYFISSVLFINPNPILFVGWSLNYEIFFYLLICCFSFYRAKSSLYFTCAVIMAAIGVRYFFNWHLTAWSPVDFFSQDFMLEFVLGFILFRTRKYFNLGSLAPLIIPATLTVMVYFELTEPMGAMIAKRFLFFGVPAFFLCAAFLGLEKKIGDNSFWKTMILLGDSSYIIYLSHFIIIYCIDWFLRTKMNVDVPHMNTASKIIVYMVIITTTIIFSILVHLHIEKKLTRFLRKLLKTGSSSQPVRE